jgi:adenylosuccinate synthase
LVLLKRSAAVNSLTSFAVTRLDVLSGFDTLKVCTEYQVLGRTTDEVPQDSAVLADVKPVYQELKGWKEDITGAKRIGDLPANARDYLKFMEERLGVPISIVSVGPERDQTIRAKSVW